MALPTVEEILKKDIFELLKIDSADEQTKSQILKTMTNTIDARVTARVADLLDDKDSQSFKEIAEKGNPEDIVQFLVDKKIDLPLIVSEEATKYKVETAHLFGLLEQ